MRWMLEWGGVAVRILGKGERGRRVRWCRVVSTESDKGNLCSREANKVCCGGRFLSWLVGFGWSEEKNAGARTTAKR